MIAIDMPMPRKCIECKLLDGDDSCPLIECEEDWTWAEQYAHCPLIDLTDDGR